jgi:hypothetical protein
MYGSPSVVMPKYRKKPSDAKGDRAIPSPITDVRVILTTFPPGQSGKGGVFWLFGMCRRVARRSSILLAERRMAMRRNYRFTSLTWEEIAFLESVLHEELELQSWCAFTWVAAFEGEVRIHLQ